MTDFTLFIFGCIFVIIIIMNEEQQLKLHSKVFILPLLGVFFIWFIYWVEIQFDLNFNKYGIFPRTIVGLRGVLFSHFIHSNTSHLFNNSIPLFVLLLCVRFFYKEVSYKVLLYGGFFTGFFTWLIARESYHIGASGMVYLLFSFVFFSGILKRHYRLVALSLMIIFLYGSMIWYIMPVKEGMSWEGHLSGFLVGIIFSFVFKNTGIVRENYEFTPTDFDLLFDENGNFSPPGDEEVKESNSD
ncbi:rhomboid family intramembrane serine protease [Polaribacter tangerinus]|uniref:rhomboid family intramembrane serine protease n=1 Tax=Polaribacter tangerinus TaxID=1920034 RepID=UPI001E4395E8|nr:rhomboid family intramembrane serine protease [Polaribacter tangerinus]